MTFVTVWTPISRMLVLNAEDWRRQGAHNLRSSEGRFICL